MSALADSTNAEPLPRPAPAKKAFAEAEPRAPADGFDSQTDPSSSEPAQAADCSDAAPAPAGGGEPSEGVGSPGSSEPALVDSTDVTTRPSRPSDIAGRRDRKAVVRLEIALPEAAPLVIVAGKGKKLGEIDNVAVRIGKLPSKSDTLKRLHSFCYGRPGVATVLKKNLREFSGFDSDDKCEKMRASAGRCAAAQLREVLTLCDLELSGTKDALIERLCTWLRKPVPSSRRSLVEKAAEEKRRAEKRKRAVEKANAHAERVKKAARKAPATLPPSKGAAGPSGGDVDGFDCYVAAKLDRLQQNNPSLGKATLLEHLRGKWAALDAEKRRAFEVRAGRPPASAPFGCCRPPLLLCAPCAVRACCCSPSLPSVHGSLCAPARARTAPPRPAAPCRAPVRRTRPRRRTARPPRCASARCRPRRRARRRSAGTSPRARR